MSYLITLFEQHSYLILFLGIFLELMALPISGEFLMSYAGYFVYQGNMNYILAVLTVFASGIAGITVTYWIGKAGGYKLIEKYGKYIHFGPERYNKISAWFERSGNKLLIFAYFIPGIRHFTGYISGISRIPYRKFFIPAYSGVFLWGICFITLGKVLGPEWKVFHEAASKYFVIFIVIIAVIITGYFVYRFNKIQLKNFFISFLKQLNERLKSIRATEIILIILTLVLIGFVSLMVGLAQDYLNNEFDQFNNITIYLVKSASYMNLAKVFIVFQSLITLAFIVLSTIIRIWSKGKNKGLEFLLLGTSLLGAQPFHDLVIKAFFYLQSFGFVGKFHSPNFPDLNAFIMIVFYGTCLFLLVRHSENRYTPVFTLIFSLLILVGIAVFNILSSNTLPSDIVGGYVYGGVWILFNFLLFELLRLEIISGKKGRSKN